MYLEFFVEDISAETALNILVPKILPGFEFKIYPFRGKGDLIKKLPDRLSAYSKWITDEIMIVVLIDRDSDDCNKLKEQLETIALDAGLISLTSSRDQFQIINRIAVEELEAWFFGDVTAIRKAYPKVPETLDKKAPYRLPDAIKGGTWEQLERLLRSYHPGGLEKIRAASEISRYMDPDRNRSPSFQVFRDALRILQQPD